MQQIKTTCAYNEGRFQCQKVTAVEILHFRSLCERQEIYKLSIMLETFTLLSHNGSVCLFFFPGGGSGAGEQRREGSTFNR